MKPVVFMFPGQGAQYYRMGRELLGAEPVFRDWMDRCDAAARPVLGRSLVDLIHSPAIAESAGFDRLLETHPALLAVVLGLAHTLVARGVTPDLLLGYSHGELVAAVFAGVVSLEDAMKLALAQARLAEERTAPARMITVLDRPELFGERPDLFAGAELAAVNTDRHFVVTVRAPQAAGFVHALERAAIDCVELPIRWGFHSALLEPLEEPLLEIATGVRFAPPTIPIVSCATAERVPRPDARHLWAVARGPVRFRDTVRGLAAETQPHWVDVGPTGTLAGFVRALLGAGTTVHAAMNPGGRDTRALAHAIEKLPRKQTAPISKEAGPMTKVWFFPGQGSQVRGMGRELFDRFPDLVAQADDVLGYSIRELCVDDPGGKLGRTEYTQPALYVVNALSFRRRLEEAGGPPDFVAGHSLGEYNALLAGEAFDFVTGLKLVKKRGELMGAVSGGSMVAVLGVDVRTIEEALARSGVTTVDIANINTPEQTVLAGPAADLERVTAALPEGRRARAVPLSVSAAFHSRYMAPVKTQLAAFFREYRFQPLTVPVMSNFTALPYRDDEIAHNLVQQVDHPVRWVEVVQYLLQEEAVAFEEVGPGQALTRMVDQIRKVPVPVNIGRHY